VDFKLDMGEQRFDALGKDLCLSDLYAKRPQLRTRMASCGGLRRVWDHCHSAAADSADLHQAWQKLCADLRGCSVAESDTSDAWQLGQTLAESLGIEQRLEEHRGMREHLRLEGGISKLWMKLKAEERLLSQGYSTCLPGPSFMTLGFPLGNNFCPNPVWFPNLLNLPETSNFRYTDIKPSQIVREIWIVAGDEALEAKRSETLKSWCSRAESRWVEVPLDGSTEALASTVARVDDGSLLDDYASCSHFGRSDAPIPASLKGAALHLMMFEDDHCKASSSSSDLANTLDKMSSILHVFAVHVAEGETEELRQTFKGFHWFRNKDAREEASYIHIDPRRLACCKKGTALNSFTGLLEKVWKSCEERCGDVEQIMNAYATAGPSTWVVLLSSPGAPHR